MVMKLETDREYLFACRNLGSSHDKKELKSLENYALNYSNSTDNLAK